MILEPNFEIKYLEFKWYDKETLTKVIESLNSLRLEFDESHNIFRTETTIYPKAQGVERGHLAIRISKKTSHTSNQGINHPYIKMPDGTKKYLDQIKDPDTGVCWWILKNIWSDERKQWLSNAHNIVGNLCLNIQNQVCEVAINGSDFTFEQLEQYLSTFKNDLWELILDESSAVQVKGKVSQSIGVNDEIVKCIHNLIDYAEKVMKNPKVELLEIQALKPRKAVKPVNRTFMEIATKTNQRFLTSRASEPSYNVAENKYILFALERCHRIIKQIVILAENKGQRYQNSIAKLQSQYDSFTDTIKVDRNIFVKELKKIRERTKIERTKIENWQKNLDKKIKNSGIELNSEPCSKNLTIMLNGFYQHSNANANEKYGFFFSIQNDNNDWEAKRDNKSLAFDLRGDFFKLFEVFEQGMQLNINFDHQYKIKDTFYKISFSKIHSIEIIGSNILEKAIQAFKKEKEIGQLLSKNNWIKSLSKKEIEEQERERLVLQSRIKLYQKNQETSLYVYKQVEPKFRTIKRLIKEFKTLGVKSSSYFPNSMTFVHNPHYQGLHNCYKKLRDITNLTDEELLLSLEQVDEIGVINMPLLYERWTFIQIISVLKDVFRFTPDDDWKYQLIDAVKTNKTDIKIGLSNELAKRYITLWYEKTLPNNKRPDFIIDLKWFAKNDEPKNNPINKKFVLDAKFYDKSTFNKVGGMMAKVDELYIDKNYSENSKNPVFLIHPCHNLISEQRTAQSWGKYSFLGETDVLDDGAYYSHNKGAIYLNPIDCSLYNDELQRLLGVFIQYKLESADINIKDVKNDLTQAVPICIRCGSSHIKYSKKTTSWYDKKTGKSVQRTPRSVWMQCTECDQIQIYNHNHNHINSSNVRLIKNGLYWTYHSARALEPFNVKCPTSGEWGDW